MSATVPHLWLAAHLIRKAEETGRLPIAQQNAEVVISAARSRKQPIPYDRDDYRSRNLFERLWCRLKDWRRIATRYDKPATNYMAGVLLAAAISYWCD